MVLKLAGLVKRGEMWIYRRTVPPKLRSIVGAREVKRTLGTGDLDQAQERWRAVKAEVERSFAEGRRAPSSTVFTPTQPQAEKSRQARFSESASELHDDRENPPLSLTFTRYYAERKLPAKTRLEWDLVLSRIQAVCGGDVRARFVTQAHVRMLKDSLLAMPARRGGGTLSPPTVQKNLGGLRAVLGWAKRNGYVSSNPAEDMIVVTKRTGDEGASRTPRTN